MFPIIARSTVGTTRNLLLGQLAPEDLGELAPHLERMPFDRGLWLAEANAPIERIWFPEDGVVSVVDDLPDGGRTEVGIFGREGMSGIARLLGADTSPHGTFVQIAGASALAAPAEAVLEAVEARPGIRRTFLRYVQAFTVQVAQTAVSNAHHSLQQRLARWLLMCHDRLDGDELVLTHEFISLMLAVRRTGVTEALHILKGMQLIRSRRGLVVILDRAGLERLAGEAYGKAEAEQEVLLGSAIRRRA